GVGRAHRRYHRRCPVDRGLSGSPAAPDLGLRSRRSPRGRFPSHQLLLGSFPGDQGQKCSSLSLGSGAFARARLLADEELARRREPSRASLHTRPASAVLTPLTSVKMSQADAPRAAESATAVVSDPPRPRVVVSPSGVAP